MNFLYTCYESIFIFTAHRSATFRELLSVSTAQPPEPEVPSILDTSNRSNSLIFTDLNAPGGQQLWGMSLFAFYTKLFSSAKFAEDLS